MTQDEVFSTLRSGAIFVSGAAAYMGLTALSATDIQTDLDHMINGAKEFWIGAGPLVGAGMLLWGRYKSSNAAKTASVAAMPGTMVVQASGADPVALASKIAALPEVHTVVSTPAVASATVSDKVVSS